MSRSGAAGAAAAFARAKPRQAAPQRRQPGAASADVGSRARQQGPGGPLCRTTRTRRRRRRRRRQTVARGVRESVSLEADSGPVASESESTAAAVVPAHCQPTAGRGGGHVTLGGGGGGAGARSAPPRRFRTRRPQRRARCSGAVRVAASESLMARSAASASRLRGPSARRSTLAAAVLATQCASARVARARARVRSCDGGESGRGLC